MNKTSLSALTASLVLHAALIVGISANALFISNAQTDPLEALQIIVIAPPLEEVSASPKELPSQPSGVQAGIVTEKPPAILEAPPPPTAEEWALASKYTLKNSKRYRYAWAQQVRSMMGTAVEGPEQGVVRFSIEIGPEGKVQKVTTIWSTSDKAEALAKAAINALPPLPPTPTGEPLIFEKTISFQPFDAGWPPIYKYDCLPDPPKFNNPWVWDGKSPTTPVAMNPPSQGYKRKAKQSECPDIPADTVDAEAADMQRQFDMWESSKLDAKN